MSSVDDEYPKIPTVYARTTYKKKSPVVEGQFSTPELRFLENNNWVWTEKLDGMNVRIQYVSMGAKAKEYLIEFKSRASEESEIPPGLLSLLNEQYRELEGKVWEIFKDRSVVLFGEGIGEGIRKAGRLYGRQQEFVLFDVWVEGWWLERHNVEDVARKLGMPIVPVVGNGTLKGMVELAKEGFHSQWGEFAAEGIVAKPQTELFTRKGERIVTKIEHKDFVKV